MKIGPTRTLLAAAGLSLFLLACANKDNDDLNTSTPAADSATVAPPATGTGMGTDTGAMADTLGAPGTMGASGSSGN